MYWHLRFCHRYRPETLISRRPKLERHIYVLTYLLLTVLKAYSHLSPLALFPLETNGKKPMGITRYLYPICCHWKLLGFSVASRNHHWQQVGLFNPFVITWYFLGLFSYWLSMESITDNRWNFLTCLSPPGNISDSFPIYRLWKLPLATAEIFYPVLHHLVTCVIYFSIRRCDVFE